MNCLFGYREGGRDPFLSGVPLVHVVTSLPYHRAPMGRGVLTLQSWKFETGLDFLRPFSSTDIGVGVVSHSIFRWRSGALCLTLPARETSRGRGRTGDFGFAVE